MTNRPSDSAGRPPNRRRVRDGRAARAMPPALSPQESLPPPFLFAGKSDAGRQREKNEDRFAAASIVLPSGEVTLLAVADGMGGAAGGEVASQRTVAELIRILNQAPPGVSDGEILAAGVAAANETVYEQAQSVAELHGMGTTLVAVLVRGQQATVAHVGDSRAYLVRDGTPYRLTADHSWVAEQVRMGDLTEEEAGASDLRNVLTRSIGVKPGVVPEVAEPFGLRPGDALLLCSDGLYGVVDDATIAAAVRDADPALAAQRLVDLANRRGGPDNITVVAGRLGPPPPAHRAPATAGFVLAANRLRRRGTVIAAGLAGVLLVAVIAIVAFVSHAQGNRAATPPLPIPTQQAPAPAAAVTHSSNFTAPAAGSNSPTTTPNPTRAAASPTWETTTVTASSPNQALPSCTATPGQGGSPILTNAPCEHVAARGDTAGKLQTEFGVSPHCLQLANQKPADLPEPLATIPDAKSPDDLNLRTGAAYRLVTPGQCQQLEQEGVSVGAAPTGSSSPTRQPATPSVPRTIPQQPSVPRAAPQVTSPGVTATP